MLRDLGHKEVPKDARTVLKTCRKSNVKGDFAHFGLIEGLTRKLSAQVGISDVVELHINIDGIPLHRSSSKALWPITCSCANILDRTPFPASIYCGSGKPVDVEEFLSQFLEEMKQLETDGITVADKHFTVILTAVICDMPARSYVKCTKGHSGYNSCDRCTQRGEYIDGRVVFPDVSGIRLRSNETFRTMEDAEHYHSLSPFCSLALDMVSSFPLDYMHMVCLGVTRRLLHLWVHGRLPFRLGALQKHLLNKELEASYLPCEFQRQPRGIKELEFWKATEYRSFHLYLGPSLLKRVLPSRLYDHFLLLHCAISILCSPVLYLDYNDYASHLLTEFSREFAKISGKSQMSYKIHALCHLASDAKLHGPLDSFSAFRFENYLGKLKKMVRFPSKPLEQISR
ncbi:unnamed protein product [Ixodes pacificus]